MITETMCFKHGELGSQTIGELKNTLWHEVRNQIVKFKADVSGVIPECYYGWLGINLFNKNQVSVNKKNIEYQEKFNMYDYGMDDQLYAAIKKYKIGDVGIYLTIYRIGSYSYYMAVCEVYGEITPTDNGEFIGCAG